MAKNINKDAPPRPLTPEELQIKELRTLKDSLGRNLKGDEIPHDLLVRAFLPDDPRPRPQVPYSSILQLPEFQALLPTHTPVLISLAVGTPDDPQSYSLLRVLETKALAQMEVEQKARAKELARALALSTKPGALGARSGLRNQAHFKEFLGTWVMAENDLQHRVKQLREHLLNSQNVSFEMRPKKYGKKVKVADEQKEAILDKIWKMIEDIAEKDQPDKTNEHIGSTTM